MSKDITRLSDLQLCLAYYGVKSYPKEFIEHCKNELDRREALQRRQAKLGHLRHGSTLDKTAQKKEIFIQPTEEITS